MLRRHLLLAPAVAAAAPGPGKVPVGPSAEFYFGPEWDKPFLYPLRTVSGRNLSRRHPLESLPGENTDHAWHRGLWWGHGIINGQDFWRELGRDKTARLILDGKPKSKKNAVDASFAMVTPAGGRLGTHRLVLTISEQGSLRFIDAKILVHADRGEPLTFGDTDDGGFAFRLSDAFREDRGARLRNAAGLEGTNKIWGQAAKWVDYSATVDGTPAGVAIFDHPSNLRHPTQWHARGYSLCAANPFASRSFSRNKGPDGAYTLPAGQTLSLSYRVVIHEGPSDPARIEQLFTAWARH